MASMTDDQASLSPTATNVLSFEMAPFDIYNPVPLTTIFTPDTQCSTRWLMPQENSLYSGQLYFVQGSSYQTISIDERYYMGCYPYSILNAFADAEYSPGVCPSGRSFIVQTSWTSDAWGGYCCPSGMSMNTLERVCQTEFNSPRTAIVGYTVSNFTFWDETRMDVENSLQGMREYKNTTVVYSGVELVPPIKVSWQREDLNLFPPAYASSVATQVGIEFTATPTILPGLSSSFPPPTSTPFNATEKYSMTEKAKFGVGVGSTIAGVACGATIFTRIWCLRRKKKKIPHPRDPELAGHSRGLRISLKGKWRAEAEGLSQPVETDGRSVIIIPGPPVEPEARV